MTGFSIPSLLENRAQQQADDIAYTYVDYEADPAGIATSLTWAQVHHRARVVADKLLARGSVGDRVAIVAPQGLDYIVGFLGAIQAGFIAVPLSVPQFGAHDERVSGALGDCAPSAVLTTSDVVEGLMTYAKPQAGRRAPQVIEVDAMDFGTSPTFGTTTRRSAPKTAYLQYTSGSTRQPNGVVITHANALINVDQIMCDFFEDPLGVPPNLAIVSWLPLFHDLGLIVTVIMPMVSGRPAVFMSPSSFLQKPARWIQLLATSGETLSAAPNFAFDLAARRTSDKDMAGMDLGDVKVIVNCSERIHASTLRRFYERFSRFNLAPDALRASYGLAEATVYVVTSSAGRPPVTQRFDYDKLVVGHAELTDSEGGVESVGCGPPRSCAVRIVNSETRVENPAGMIGEIWLQGENIASAYWRRTELSEYTFGAELVNPSPGTAEGPWLRTGDLGVMVDGELFIMGRIKDLVIVNGRNHYPDDIEATVREITGGRVAAISVPGDSTERLAAIAELKLSPEAGDMKHKLHQLKGKVTAAISRSHNLRLADLVFVPPGSIPITTSGKVRRASCVDRYVQDGFSRLDSAP